MLEKELADVTKLGGPSAIVTALRSDAELGLSSSVVSARASGARACGC